ncbi:ABC-type transport auxiliary lipoprotein family protein [Thiobacillus thioparus]|uniref:ABC-type transport auxiliary lipoprotein family protein n=1 Tax=Thiobacillus thioparus TaxID=931 RepID=UPI0003609858|nr:ABC-type transport auxiliary lipoprotein family protein [Thiobacillus thioparus]
MKTGLSLMALVFALSGCVNFGQSANAPSVVYYVLNDAEPATAPTPVPADALKDPDPLRAKERVESYAPTLLVLDTTAGGFYDSDQLVFSRSAGTRGQYQFARWTERPGRRFAELLRARLDQLGRYRVAPAGGVVRGDLMLDTRLIEFYHDATSEPGQVRLELRAELVDLKQRRLLGRHTFEQKVPLTTYDAAGAAQASNLAVSRVLDDVSAWLATFK